MTRLACLAIALLFATAAPAAENDAALVELDAEISNKLDNDPWDEDSKEFVRAMWQDYREAFLAGPESSSTRSVFGKIPAVQDYSEYIGAYSSPRPGAIVSRIENVHDQPWIEVVRDEAGRLLVKLEDHTIPAVRTNKTLVITTGDVVYSFLPRLGDKPYCTLEFFFIIRTDEGFFFANPGAPPDAWRPLQKTKDK